MRKRRKIDLRPFPGQLDILKSMLDDNIRIFLAVCGRGWGKTEGYLILLQYLAAQALQTENDWVAWIATPTMSGTGDKPWRTLSRVFDPKGDFHAYNPHVDSTGKSIRIKNVTIRLRPTIGRDSGVLEGDAINLLIPDEARMTPREVWDSLYPAVTRANGKVFIATTPPDDWLECNNGWIRELWEDGQKGKKGIKSVQFRTFDSPVYGGYVLPPIPKIMELANYSQPDLDKFLDAQYQLLNKIDFIVDQTKKNPSALECLNILSKDETDKEYHEAVRLMIEKRLDVLNNHVVKLLARGEPEEASRLYDGTWLERPMSVGEDLLNYVKAGLRPGQTYSMTVDGELIPGGKLVEIWEEPQKESTYVMGVDTSGGTAGDNSVVSIFKRPVKNNDPIRLVCTLTTNIMPPDELGRRSYMLAKKYNDALIVAERTGAWGVTALIAIRDMAAEKKDGVWILKDDEKDAELVSASSISFQHLGWETTKQSKGQMLTTMRRLLNTKSVIIPCQEYYEELVNFNWSIKAGEKDDRIMSVALALQGLVNCPIERLQPPVPWDERYQAMCLARRDKNHPNEEEALQAVGNGWLGSEGEW